MIKYEDECVDCDLSCIGTSCPYVNVPHYYCDLCGEEIYENMIQEVTNHYHKECFVKEFGEEDE